MPTGIPSEEGAKFVRNTQEDDIYLPHLALGPMKNPFVSYLITVIIHRPDGGSVLWWNRLIGWILFVVYVDAIVEI